MRSISLPTFPVFTTEKLDCGLRMGLHKEQPLQNSGKLEFHHITFAWKHFLLSWTFGTELIIVTIKLESLQLGVFLVFAFWLYGECDL